MLNKDKEIRKLRKELKEANEALAECSNPINQ